MTPKNIHKIFIPQKYSFFWTPPKNIEIQNFEPPKNYLSLRMYENIRVPLGVKQPLKNRQNKDLNDTW